MRKTCVLFEAGPMLDAKKTGVGYYVEHLMSSLAAHHASELDLTGYYFDFLGKNHKTAPTTPGLRFQKIQLVPGKLLPACRRFGFQPFLEMFTRQKSDIVLFTNYVSLPMLSKRRTALIIYDLSFLDLPEYTQDRNLTFLQRFCLSSIRKADFIITISKFTKDRLLHHIPDLKADIVITPIPPAETNTPQPLNNRLTDLGIAEGGYILHIGTIEPRKNLQALIEAYAELGPAVREKHTLVLAGGRGWKEDGIIEKVETLQKQGLRIILTGYLSEEEKIALYAHAACFVMPSHYEGFGMPILEAMQFGIPVLVSDIPVFHEVAGDAAVYFNKDDPQLIAEAIGGLLSDPERQQQLIRRAKKQLATFNWKGNAAIVAAALQR